MEIEIGSRSRPAAARKVVPAPPVSVKRRLVGLSLLPDTLVQVDTWAKRRGLSRSGLINALVTEGLERWREQDGKTEGR